MNRCDWIRIGVLCLLATPALAGPPADPPNVVIVFADDLGYADLGCFGASPSSTPNLDRMAAEGTRLTSFYVAQAVCSASRTALLTGCYPNRVGILGALGPKSTIGIDDGEILLPEVFRSRGYATAIYGKWHLGHQAKFLPTRHGFDDYFGLPYSNDMWPKHPTDPNYPDLPLIEGDRQVAANPDQTTLTGAYAERAVKFIEAHRDRPFFVYLPHSMPHVPLFASKPFDGRTGRGLHADVLAEIDASVGSILATLKRLDLDEKTLVIFTSDNGPWLSYGDHAGSAGPFREGKGTTFEGGVRVPFVARWPGAIRAGSTSDRPAMTIDLLPTLAQLVGAERPAVRPIDGRDMGGLLLGESGAKSPQDAYFFFWGGALEAVRSGRWKLHLPHDYRSMVGQAPGSGGTPGKYVIRKIGRSLFDLEADPGETTDVAAAHPDVVARLEALAETARRDLGDTATDRKGEGVRPPGRL